jgi:hypothetical protein
MVKLYRCEFCVKLTSASFWVRRMCYFMQLLTNTVHYTSDCHRLSKECYVKHVNDHFLHVTVSYEVYIHVEKKTICKSCFMKILGETTRFLETLL